MYIRILLFFHAQEHVLRAIKCITIALSSLHALEVPVIQECNPASTFGVLRSMIPDEQSLQHCHEGSGLSSLKVLRIYQVRACHLWAIVLIDRSSFACVCIRAATRNTPAEQHTDSSHSILAGATMELRF